MKAIPPPPTAHRPGRPHLSGRMGEAIRSWAVNEMRIVSKKDVNAIYTAARRIGMKIQTCGRNLPGAPKLKPGTLRVWRIK